MLIVLALRQACEGRFVWHATARRNLAQSLVHLREFFPFEINLVSLESRPDPCRSLLVASDNFCHFLLK